MAQKLVRITNGDQEAHVSPRSVAAWERNGWTAGENGSSEESTTESEPDPPAKKTAAKKATTRKAD